MRSDHKDGFSNDPLNCIARGWSFDGVHSFCDLMNAWGSCLEQGCYVRPDGRLCEIDNSPEAMARRVREMRREEGKR